MVEPPCSSARGKRESASSNRSRVGGSRSASAAIWVIDVYVPAPMSLGALRTTAVPSPYARTQACAGSRGDLFMAVAMPSPTR